MTKIEVKSKGAASHSSVMKHRRLISIAAVLLVCCLAFVGVVGATSVSAPNALVTEMSNDDIVTHLTENPNDWNMISVNNFSEGGIFTTGCLYALNFTAIEVYDNPDTTNNEEDDHLSKYGDWIVDFVLTINNTREDDAEYIVLGDDMDPNAECPNPQGFLIGNYGGFGWLKVPSINLPNSWAIQNFQFPYNSQEPIVSTLMPQEYEYIYNGVGTFLCALYLSEEFVTSNPNYVVTLELRMLNTTEYPLPNSPLVEHNDRKFFVDNSIRVGQAFRYSQDWDITYLNETGEPLVYEDGKSNRVTYNASTGEFTLVNPIRDGYVFGGWLNTTSEENEGTEVTVSGLTHIGSLEYKATWKKLHTVTFINEGNPHYVNDSVVDGTPVTAPSIPSKEGYTFEGWCSDEGLTTSYDFDTPVTGPLTLFANWTANTYTVKFDANDGEGTMADQSFTYDEESKALTANAFTRDGHTFNGWNTKEDGSGNAYSDKQSVQNLTAENGVTVTLYAQWKENEKTPTVTPDSNKPNRVITTTKPTYQVVFYPNGGSGEMNAVTFVEGEQKALPANTFSRDGYTFKGWALTPEGEVFYTDGESVLIDGATSLYAVWEEVVQEKPEEPTDDPSDKPTEPTTPAPLLSVLAGLGAAVLLRRK